MIKLKPILSSLAMGLLITTGLMMAGCTKEGPQGPAGEDGTDGADGANGQDAEMQCGTCHDMTTDVKARIIQWEASKHNTGGNFERNGASCAGCHTNEGFNDIMENGGEDMVASGTMSNPTMIGCRTCHNIHETYTPADWQLKGTASVDLIVGGETDQGTGNTCANCHQARDAGIVGTATPGEGTFNITSSRFGPHHGPQANMIAADGGFEIPGDLAYSTGPHTSMEGGCTTCHMAEPYGTQAGGHQMAMGYEYHGSLVPNTAGCQECHEGIEEFDFAGTQSDVQELLDELAAELEAQGLLVDGSPVTGEVETNKAGAVYNYFFVLEDYSLGVHNHRYAKALLQNSLDAIQE